MSSRCRSSRRDWIAPLVLLVLAAIPFLSVPGGSIHLETDYLDWMYPWRYQRVGERSDACVLLANRELQDALLAYYPVDDLFNETLKRGRLLLWNPYQFCGYPVQAVGHPSLVDPIRIAAHRLLSPLAARETLLFVNLWMCGLFAYGYLRTMGLARYASLVGAVVYMLGGSNFLRLDEEFFTAAGAHLVLALLLIEKTMRTRTVAWAAGLALGIGSIMLMGQWQLMTYAVLASIGYAACRLAGSRWDGRSAALLCGAFTVGLAMGSVQLLPSLELFAESQRPSISLSKLFANSRFLPENLLTLLVPDALGTPLHQFYLTRIKSGVQTYQELYAYVGAVPLALAVLACLAWPARLRILWIPAIIALLYAMGTPGITGLYWIVPGFKSFTPVRMLTIYALCASLLAGYGVQAFIEERISLKALYACMLAWLGVTLAVCALCAAASNDRLLLAALTQYVPGGLLERPPFVTDGAAYTRLVVEAVRDHYRLANPSFWVPLALGWAGLGLLHASRSGRLGALPFRVLFVAVVASDLVFAGLRFAPLFPASTLAPPTPGLQVLRQSEAGPHRVAAVIRGIHPDLATLLRVQELAGYASMFPARYQRLMAGLSRREQSPVMADLWDGLGYTRGMADLLGVRFHYTTPLDDLPPALGRPVHHGELNVYENPTALGRCFLVPRAERVADPERILEAMLDPGFNPRSVVYLEEDAPSLPGGQVRGAVRDLDYGGDRLSMTVAADRPCFLVCSDQWYPGWEARVSGRPAHLYRADYCFRAIYLESGTHRVEMVFRPRSFLVGSAITLICALLCLAAIAASWRRPGKPLP